MSTTNKLLIVLIFLCIVDIVIPLPLLGITLVYVVAARPPWFADLVDKVYRAK